MDQQQLELNFEAQDGVEDAARKVILLGAYAEARAKKRQEAEKAKLLAQIVKSVEHITGRSSDAEVM